MRNTPEPQELQLPVQFTFLTRHTVQDTTDVLENTFELLFESGLGTEIVSMTITIIIIIPVHREEKRFIEGRKHCITALQDIRIQETSHEFLDLQILFRLC